jgi:hypothetical protein
VLLNDAIPFPGGRRKIIESFSISADGDQRRTDVSSAESILIIRLKPEWRYLTPAVDLPAPNDASATPRGGIKEVYSMNLVDAQNRLMGGAARHEVQRLPVTGRRERKRPSSEERADSCAAAVSKWRDKFVAMQMNEVR